MVLKFSFLPLPYLCIFLLIFVSCYHVLPYLINILCNFQLCLLFLFENTWSQTPLSQGKLVRKESVTEGFENFPRAFIGMLRGDSIGKALVRA